MGPGESSLQYIEGDEGEEEAKSYLRCRVKGTKFSEKSGTYVFGVGRK